MTQPTWGSCSFACETIPNERVLPNGNKPHRPSRAPAHQARILPTCYRPKDTCTCKCPPDPRTLSSCTCTSPRDHREPPPVRVRHCKLQPWFPTTRRPEVSHQHRSTSVHTRPWIDVHHEHRLDDPVGCHRHSRCRCPVVLVLATTTGVVPIPPTRCDDASPAYPARSGRLHTGRRITVSPGHTNLGFPTACIASYRRIVGRTYPRRWILVHEQPPTQSPQRQRISLNHKHAV